MTYEIYNDNDFDALIDMASDLWKSSSREELVRDLSEAIKQDKFEIYFARPANGGYAGFVFVSIRSDYVEGASGSPVGYLEGIYVKPEYRKQHVGRELNQVAEKWAAERGCKQMGSDTWEWHKDSRAFHAKIGYREEDVIVHFLKEIQ